MAEDFAIVCDVNCDLSRELRNEYDIDYIKGFFTYPDGTEEPSFLDWEDCVNIPDCTPDKFYAALRKNPNGFATSPAGSELMFEFFEKYIKEGRGVLAFSISSAISGTYGFMEAAKKDILEKYPDARILIVDTLSFSAAVGLLAIYASVERSGGRSLEETYELSMAKRDKLHQAGWLDDLKFVAKKGRMNNAKAYMGTLIGIKPIGDLDRNGMTTVIGKVKGEKAAFDALIKYMEAIGEELSEQVILIAHSVRPAQAQQYKTLIEQRFSPKKIYICEVFPSDGINIGPGLMAAYFIGSPKSEGMTKEKETLQKIINPK